MARHRCASAPASFARWRSAPRDPTTPPRSPPQGARGEVHGLYVDPDRIGTGLGHALLRHAADDLAARGCDTLVVWHFVGNDRAARFYARAGLRPDGTLRRSPHGADEVRLRRRLDVGAPH
ncbi:MAG TPA: GNAT family N-acetyltransferase [Gaiellaceae bacterium]|nr:GNAT family N-acetyltransferase [Gaiellaceae bacterium]